MKRAFKLAFYVVLLFSFVVGMGIYGVNEAKLQQTISQEKVSTNAQAEPDEISNVPTTTVQEQAAIDVP